MIYVQASIKLHPGKLQDFTSLINELLPVVGKHGWKLVGSYATLVGRLNRWWTYGNCRMRQRSPQRWAMRNSRSAEQKYRR